MSRGTTNTNVRGSSYDRRVRRAWLLKTFESNQAGRCRCYRCGKLLDLETLTVDRILPGCLGGTYTRENIRPACSTCNSETGGVLGAERSASL